MSASINVSGARDRRMREGAVVEARVERAVADLLEGRARHLVVELELDQRKTLGRERQEGGEPDEFGIGQGSETDVPRDVALDCACLSVERCGVLEDA